MEALVSHYESRLDEAGFFFPLTKAAGMKVVFRNMFSRMPLTRADVQMLHGVMRQMVRWRHKDDPGGDGPENGSGNAPEK